MITAVSPVGRRAAGARVFPTLGSGSRGTFRGVLMRECCRPYEVAGDVHRAKGEGATWSRPRHPSAPPRAGGGAAHPLGVEREGSGHTATGPGLSRWAPWWKTATARPTGRPTADRWRTPGRPTPSDKATGPTVATRSERTGRR